MNAIDVIKRLDLKPLPEEGGFYKELYQSEGFIPSEALANHSSKRSYVSLIYYLITPTSFSALHKVKSDEMFHFYLGDPVEMVQINQNGDLKKTIIGSNINDKHIPYAVVPRDIWQGTKLVEGGKWALLGCSVSPGFHYDDFDILDRKDLIEKFPQHRSIITAFTHK